MTDHGNVFGIYISFYFRIINNIMILPPIIIKVVTSKSFTESIRFETFVVIFVVGLCPDVWDVGVVVVVRGLSMPGSAVWVACNGAYW